MRSLIYFDDADDKEFKNNDVISLKDEDWDTVKENIETVYNDLLKKNTTLI